MPPLEPIPNLDSVLAKLGEAALEGAPPAGDEEAAAAAVAAKIEGEQQNTAPEETPASGEGEGHSEPALPAIEPPVSWNAAAKDAFGKLPRHLQEVVAERERDRESYLSRQSNEAAESRKAVEAERTRMAEDRQKALTQFDGVLNAVITSDPIIKEGRSINWPQLAMTDPASYAAKKAIYDDRVAQLQAAIQQRQALAQQVVADQQIRQQEFLKEEEKHLYEKVPEWSDREKARVAVREITDHARARYGISEEELGRVGDHRALLILRDSLTLARENATLKAELEKAKATKAQTLKEIEPKRAAALVPKVTAPRAPVEGKGPSERTKVLLTQARKTGKDSDRVDAVLAALQGT